MNSQRTLKSLEIILESFLTRAVALKAPRLAVLESMNQLDDLARAAVDGQDVTDDVADWIVKRRNLVADKRLRPTDVNRIEKMLRTVSGSMGRTVQSPAHRKVSQVIGSWPADNAHKSETGTSLTLKRKSELGKSSESSIALFNNVLQNISGLFNDSAQGHEHILSVLDENLTKAIVQKSREALLLSGIIIYYLRQGNYKVSPFVKRLKEAEKILKEAAQNA